MTNESPLQYEAWIEDAFRGVVKKALRFVQDHGLPGDHHFYITFETKNNGVSLSKWIIDQYPEEMTVVLQHQYTDLQVEDDYVHLTLTFNGKQETLVIPFLAITSFADPSVNFGLQIKTTTDLKQEDKYANNSKAEQNKENIEQISQKDDAAFNKKHNEGNVVSESKIGEVIALDKFRK